MQPRRRFVSLQTLLLISAFALCSIASLAGIAWWRAAHALSGVAADIRHASAQAVVLRPVQIASSRFALFRPTADYRSAVVFEGSLFVCGRSGLTQFDKQGRSIKEWRAGLELPATTLTVVAVRRGAGDPELWIATATAGVLIFDGQAMRQLLPDTLPLRSVSALLPLADGRVLLGTPNSGLFVSNAHQANLFHSEFAKAQVTALAGDEEALWVGTRSEGAWLWRGGQVTRFEDELPDPQVLSMVSAGEATWIGTPVGVAEFRNGRFERKLATGLFAQAVADWRGSLFISTVDEGTFTVPDSVQAPRRARPSVASNQSFSALLSTPELLLGIASDRVLALPAGDEIVPPDTQSLSAAHVTALASDGLDRLWIGYFDRGLDLYALDSSGSRSHLEDDRTFCINRIKESPDGKTMAVATANGLLLLDHLGHLHQTLTRANGLLADHVTDVLFDKNNQGMVVATPAGVTFVRDGLSSSIYAFQGLVNNHVYTLAQFDASGSRKLFVGTLGGYSVVQNQAVQASFTTANSDLQQNWITASAEAWGNVYLGTYGSGVVRLTPQGELQPFRDFSAGLGRIEINSNAMLATENALYVGSAGRGLAILRRNSERWKWIAAGLPSLNVTALAVQRNVLYVGTDNGLVYTQEPL